MVSNIIGGNLYSHSMLSSGMALFTCWRFRKDTTLAAFASKSATIRTRKLVLFSCINMLLAIFAMYWLSRGLNKLTWERPQLATLWLGMQGVTLYSRAHLEQEAPTF